MRALTPAEAEVLRACADPQVTEAACADITVLENLVASGRVSVRMIEHPLLPGYDVPCFDATELGRLALKFAIPSPGGT